MNTYIYIYSPPDWKYVPPGLHFQATMLVQSRHFAAVLHDNGEAVFRGLHVRGPN